jgi:hypothetical protein
VDSEQLVSRSTLSSNSYESRTRRNISGRGQHQNAVQLAPMPITPAPKIMFDHQDKYA